MSEQSLRRTLVLLSVLVLAVGLAPPPAVAAIPEESTPPTPAEADPAITALAAVTPEQPASPPDGGGELLDVYSGLDGAGGLELAAPPDVAERPAGVAAGVEAAVDADGEVPVIIRLRDQADLAAVGREAAQAGRAAAAVAGREQGAGFARDAAQAARGQVVVDALQTVARESQPAVRALLADQQAEDVRELWVVTGSRPPWTARHSRQSPRTRTSRA